jgi:spectinomycin phosphotransferase
MLKKPDITDDTIIEVLRNSFCIGISQVSFLPGGYITSAAYRLTAENDDSYFLKLQQGNFNEVAVAVPSFLHAHGIRQVLAPIETANHTLWTHKHGFDWILYPFFDGKTGFEVALSKAQWTALGQIMKAVHATILPAGLVERIPREDYSPKLRNRVKAFHQRVGKESYDDPIAADFAELWKTKCDEIRCMVDRAEQLADTLQKREIKPVLCHSDLHGRNILIRADGEMAIVDWDAPILAPKERDLMFIGGGVGGIWNNPEEVNWFYQGYGRTEVDLVALAYYRYERIVADIAECSDEIFGMRGSVEDRRKRLRLGEQFLPNNVVDIAHRSYKKLLERSPAETFLHSSST